MSAKIAALRRVLVFWVHSAGGVLVISFLSLLTLSSSTAFTSIGNKCFTLRLIKRGLWSLFATLTIAALTRPSLPGNNSSTLASFQNIRFVESSFRITSPTATSGPQRDLDFAAWFSRKFNLRSGVPFFFAAGRNAWYNYLTSIPKW